MMSASTRSKLAAKLRADGTLGDSKKPAGITREAIVNPQSKAVDRALRNQRKAGGERWLAPSAQQPVLP